MTTEQLFFTIIGGMLLGALWLFIWGAQAGASSQMNLPTQYYDTGGQPMLKIVRNEPAQRDPLALEEIAPPKETARQVPRGYQIIEYDYGFTVRDDVGRSFKMWAYLEGWRPTFAHYTTYFKEDHKDADDDEPDDYGYGYILVYPTFATALEALQEYINAEEAKQSRERIRKARLSAEPKKIYK